MFGRLEDFAAVSALALEHGASVVQAMGQDVDIGVGPRHQLAVIPDDAIDFVERHSHCLVSRSAGPESRRYALCFTWAVKSSMFRGMSIDNRTARKSTLELAKDWGYGLPRRRRWRNIRIFREA